MAPGIALALSAYALWGLLPLYFKLLLQVPALQILCHRMLWSLLLLAAIVLLRRGGAWLHELKPRMLLRFAASATLLSCNWGLNIWAINHGQVLAASLEFVINPLLSVLLGALVLGEALHGAQWLAVAIAAVGVAWLGALQGQAPWLALGIAASFAAYGLLRKTAPLDALQGLTLEAALLAPPALFYLAWCAWHSADGFVAGG